MKTLGSLLLFLLFLLVSCEEKNYYYDEIYIHDNITKGSIIGKVAQVTSNAKVYVSQINKVDSVVISPIDGAFKLNNLPIGNYDLSVKADNFRIYQLSNVMVQSAGNTYVGEIDLSTIPDLVSSHYPKDMDEIVYNNLYSRLTISVIFTRPMNRESVEKAFSTEPATEGIFHWGQYSTEPNRLYYTDWEKNWGYDPGATITTYSKITAFSYQVAQKDSYMDTTYTVKLSTQAEDTSGNALRFPLAYNFSTIQSSSTQNAILTAPSHGDREVDLLSAQGIQITFPRNMDAATTEAAVTISPATDAIFIWPAHNQLTIYTGGVLRADTKYDIAIGAAAEDADGVALGTPFSFAFETTSVGFTNTSPRNGEVFVSPTGKIYLYFNTYMQKSSVQSAFSINPAVSGALDWHNSSKTVMVFTPNQNLQGNTKYTVTIGAGAKDLNGTMLNAPYMFSFIVRPD